MASCGELASFALYLSELTWDIIYKQRMSRADRMKLMTSVTIIIYMQVLSVSLFWTGAVLCNTVHVIVSGLVFLVLIHGGRQSLSMPQNSLLNTLRYAVTTSFGSICYGSLFTAAIRTLRWEVCMFGFDFPYRHQAI